MLRVGLINSSEVVPTVTFFRDEIRSVEKIYKQSYAFYERLKNAVAEIYQSTFVTAEHLYHMVVFDDREIIFVSENQRWRWKRQLKYKRPDCCDDNAEPGNCERISSAIRDLGCQNQL